MLYDEGIVTSQKKNKMVEKDSFCIVKGNKVQIKFGIYLRWAIEGLSFHVSLSDLKVFSTITAIRMRVCRQNA